MPGQPFTLYIMGLVEGAIARVAGTGRERGDVPGWVMITVMTAMLVLAILIPFREAIVDAINEALDSVTNAPPQ